MYPHLLPVLLAAIGVAASLADSPVGYLDQLGQHDVSDGLEKRAPNSLGFSGMRGKKSELEDGDDGLDKRSGNTLGFSGMRGKKDDFENPDDSPFEKRARSNLGFSGMRGKKDDFEDADDGGVFEKRTRNNLGFSGMRGKKADELVMEDLQELADKRGNGRNSLGFSGMRGKKDADQEDTLEMVNAFKRARSAAFVGMRGRRENNQAFFGMRGKRGDAIGGLEDADEVYGYLQTPEATRDRIVTFRSKRYLPAHWQSVALRNSKKTPFSGFIGLRGKRSLPSSFQESQEMIH